MWTVYRWTNSRRTDRVERLGEEFLWFLLDWGNCRSTPIAIIASMCGGLWDGCERAVRWLWDGCEMAVVLGSSASIRYHCLKNPFCWAQRAGASCSPCTEHVMLPWIIMLPCGPGSGKTLPYVVCACFPFKIYEWISFKCSKVQRAADRLMFGISQWNPFAVLRCVWLWFCQSTFFSRAHRKV